MKLLLIINLGIIASFGLTVLTEFLWHNSTWRVYPEFLCIPVIVGVAVGLAAKRQARLAAALSLAPRAVWLIIGTNTGHWDTLRWAITTALISVYFAAGIGTAIVVGRRMDRVVKGGSSPSQEHA
jgi:hypothetical protein